MMRRTAIIACLGAWALSLGSLVVGIVLLVSQDIVAWDPVPGLPDTYESRTITVGPVGLVLLGVGLLGMIGLLVLHAAGRLHRD